MSKLTVKTHHRGTFVKITLSVMRFHNDYNEMTTGPININDMAEIIIKLKGLTEPQYHIGQNIQFKKTDNAKNLIVTIDIASADFKKQFFCQHEGVEVPMSSKKYDSCVGSSPYSMLYVIELNITVHATMPAVSSICNEIYEETEFTDFELQADDGSMPMHKSVLFVHSEMFRGMLRGQWKETEADSMRMPGVTVQTLQHLKQYMYLGTVPDEGLEPLLVVAKYCLMDKLAAACIEKLVSTVKVETFDALIQLACQKGIPELVRALVLRIPDDVINGISKMEINGKNANDKK
ncbi:uncharacterized protein LOC133531346 [Cydia pomonella]|uniref:uncharacterized protein LOC133531346 n=1 Tax=Cydia pomonella TaxID=82600 RepID=UPI002ADD8214|nr:uncharacterized protein LOC133531346 [Cydia pomonella]